MLPAAELCKSSLHVQGFECTAWCVRLAGDHQSGNQEHIVFDSRPPTPFWGGCVCQRPVDVSFRLMACRFLACGFHSDFSATPVENNLG